MLQQVVILSGHSLFTQGVAKRFEQFPERVQIHFINPKDEDSFDKIANIQPAAIIISFSEAESKENCLLCDLISTFPAVRVIRLAVDQDPVQVITSKQSQLNEVRDILDLLNGE
jgi:DNA-binding NarL/FixJ family response regulator